MHTQMTKVQEHNNLPSVYTVKGRIKALNYCTNQKLVRKGSMHFLPEEEVAIYNEDRIKEYFYRENRISVRGRHRSGLYKAKRIHVRFLEDLHIHEVENPSEETIEFLDRNGILYFQKETKKQDDIEGILSAISKQDWPIVEGEIKDDLYKAAQEFVKTVQFYLREKNFKALEVDLVEYPLVNKYWLKNKKERRGLVKSELSKLSEEIFTPRVIQSIIETDLNSIYPCGDKMVLGMSEVGIDKNNSFKIKMIESW